jgi:hypothetical protein
MVLYVVIVTGLQGLVIHIVVILPVSGSASRNLSLVTCRPPNDKCCSQELLETHILFFPYWLLQKNTLYSYIINIDRLCSLVVRVSG